MMHKANICTHMQHIPLKIPSKNNRGFSVVKMACLCSRIKIGLIQLIVFDSILKKIECRSVKTKILVLFEIDTTTDFSVCVKCKLHRINFTRVHPVGACPDEFYVASV
jgi:hypothetical protein